MKSFYRCFILVLFSLGQYSIVKSENTPISPAWVLGHIVWEDSLNTQDGVLNLVDGYISRMIPVNGVIIDSPWSTSYNDFNWDYTRYPNPSQLSAELARRNIKPILWMTGAVNAECSDVPISCCETYNYVLQNGYAVNEGRLFTWWKGNGIHIDFTNEEAKQWWYSQLDKVFDGIYGFKVDGAEVGLGEPVNTSIGEMSNTEFRYCYYDAMYDYVTSKKPDTGIIYARPYSYQGPGNYANPYKLSIGWCGDFEGTYSGLKKQIADIYQSAMNGYCAVGCEIGGFYGETPTAESLIRYAQFASMTACMINGGANGPFRGHLPWWHGEKYEKIYRFYATLHSELVPYIFSEIVDCHLYGGTLLNRCSIDNLTHFLGRSVFTKAIASDENEDFCLPEEGVYFNFFTDEIIEGGTSVSTTKEIRDYPIFIKGGSVIPMNIQSNVTEIGDESMKDKKVLLIYPSSSFEKKIHWPLGDGKEYEDIIVKYNEKGLISVESDNQQEFVLLIHDIDNVEEVEGADSWSYNQTKRLLTINAHGSQIQLSIINSNETAIMCQKLNSLENFRFYNIDGTAGRNSKGVKIVNSNKNQLNKTSKVIIR